MSIYDDWFHIFDYQRLCFDQVPVIDVENFLEKYPDFNVNVSEDGDFFKTALDRASVCLNPKIVRTLLKHGAEFEDNQDISKTPLGMTLSEQIYDLGDFIKPNDPGKKNRKETVAILLIESHGTKRQTVTDVDPPSLYDTALIMCVIDNFLRVAKTLLEHGANPNQRRGEYDKRILFLQDAEDPDDCSISPEMLELLIDYGANIFYKNAEDFGRVPFEINHPGELNTDNLVALYTEKGRLDLLMKIYEMGFDMEETGAAIALPHAFIIPKSYESGVAQFLLRVVTNYVDDEISRRNHKYTEAMRYTEFCIHLTSLGLDDLLTRNIAHTLVKTS